MTDPVHFVVPLFPNVTQLDLTGPVQVFSKLPGAVIDLAWHRIEPVPTDAGFSILPTTTFDAVPQADVLMVPGGQGAFDLLEDAAAIEFVRRQAAVARYVTSARWSWERRRFRASAATPAPRPSRPRSTRRGTAAFAQRDLASICPQPPFDAGGPGRPEADSEEVAAAIARNRVVRGMRCGGPFGGLSDERHRPERPDLETARRDLR